MSLCLGLSDISSWLNFEYASGTDMPLKWHWVLSVSHEKGRGVYDVNSDCLGEMVAICHHSPLYSDQLPTCNEWIVCTERVFSAKTVLNVQPVSEGKKGNSPEPDIEDGRRETPNYTAFEKVKPLDLESPAMEGKTPHHLLALFGVRPPYSEIRPRLQHQQTDAHQALFSLN